MKAVQLAVGLEPGQVLLELPGQVPPVALALVVALEPGQAPEVEPALAELLALVEVLVQEPAPGATRELAVEMAPAPAAS